MKAEDQSADSSKAYSKSRAFNGQ